MSLLNILNNTKYSILEISKTVVLTTVTTTIIYITKLLNDQITTLNSHLKLTTESLKSLKKEVTFLKKTITTQNTQISNLKQQIIERDNKIVTEITIPNADIITAQNEMTQFYIKTAGCIILGFVAVGLIYSITSNTTIFSLKSMIPESSYKFIQRNTPFFQEKAEYYHYDKQTDTNWVVNITNNENVDLKVKYNGGTDYTTLYEWVASLTKDNSGGAGDATGSTIDLATAVSTATNSTSLTQVPTVSAVERASSFDLDVAASIAAQMAEQFSRM